MAGLVPAPRRGRGPSAWLLALAACGAPSACAKDAAWVDKLDHGSFHGFPTLAEAEALLEGWLSEYPGLIRRERIGESFERRPIDAYVLAARPRAAASQGAPGGDAGKAQLLITALMHSREPATLTVVLYAMGHLMELYQGGDPEAVYVLEGRELWAVPFVNPDGYVANEKLPFRRGGMIRKNRRPTCKSSRMSGVDINRNFGVAWRKDAFPKCGEEYGGTAPFSEPETKAVKRVCEDNKFRAVMNFHSFGSMLTHPWNYAASKAKAKLPVPDDDAIYRELQAAFKFDLFGAAINTVGYTAIGEADDWMYSARGAIAMSPEVGPESGGFYPDKGLIRGIDSLNFKRAVHLLVKVGLELKVEWEADTATDTLRLRLNNSGLSPSAGAALRVVVVGLAADAAVAQAAAAAISGKAPDVFPALGGAALPAWLEGPAAVFEVPPLPRRSSAVYLVRTGQGGAKLAGLRLCALEVGAGRACHCHESAEGRSSRAAAATRRALPGAAGDDDAALCGVAQAQQPEQAPQLASVATGQPPRLEVRGPAETEKLSPPKSMKAPDETEKLSPPQSMKAPAETEKLPPPQSMKAPAETEKLPPPQSMKAPAETEKLPPPKSTKERDNDTGVVVGALAFAGAGVLVLLSVACKGRTRMQESAVNDSDEAVPSLRPQDGPVRTLGRTAPV